MATSKASSRKYKKVSCHKTKTAAKSAAKTMRGTGKTAQVKKSAAGVYCVYSAGKRKTGTIKRTGQKIGAMKRRTRK